MFPKNIFLLIVAVMLLVSCEAEKNYPGVEYAPQMYHSVPYEPLSQFTEDNVDGLLETWYYNTIDKAPNTISTEYTNKKYIINSLEPVEGTIKRQEYSSVEELDSVGNRQLLIYNIDADDFETAGRILKNPVPKTDEVMEEGSALYGSFCSHCHGGGGAGDGKVGKVYKGVANLLGGAYKNLPQGLSDNPFYEDALWYKAKTEIKLGKKDAAKHDLQDIIVSGGFYAERAIVLLKEL